MSKLFNSNEDRELWIKLNAERQIEFDKNCFTPDGKPYANALNPRSMDEAMEVSRRQCEHDEEKGKLRFSMEELLTLDYEGLKAISDANHKKWCHEFEALDTADDDGNDGEDDDDSERLYEPKDIIFHISKTEDDETCVFMTTKECWERDQCQSDNLGGHNVPNRILEDCGVCSGELMESVFELNGKFRQEEVKKRLLEAGFSEDEGFSAFMERNSE